MVIPMLGDNQLTPGLSPFISHRSPGEAKYLIIEEMIITGYARIPGTPLFADNCCIIL
jgi:hypothetical protein